MASQAAKEVAREVIRTVGKGRRANISKIGVEKGYSVQSARSGKITKTKSYQAEVTPLIQSLEEERRAIILRLKKVRSKARYRDLIDGLDKITKNLQLLTGGATENIAMGVAELSNAELERLVAGGNK